MIFSVYLDDAQHTAFIEGFRKSIYKHKSEYGRKLLLGKPVKVLYRNRSMDELVEMGVGLRKDLRRLLDREAMDAYSGAEISSRLATIEEQLIKLVELCGPLYSPRRTF